MQSTSTIVKEHPFTDSIARSTDGGDSDSSADCTMPRDRPSFRVIIVGNTMVGKTSIMVRACYDRFGLMAESATIGAEHFYRVLHIDGRELELEIWDTAGQERFRALVPLYYRRAVGALVVYDVTSRSSYDIAISWAQELREKVISLTVIFLVGNKTDLAVSNEQRAVSTEEASLYAEQRNMYFMETSAKSGANIPETLEVLARALLEKNDETKKLREQAKRFEQLRSHRDDDDKTCCK